MSKKNKYEGFLNITMILECLRFYSLELLVASLG